MNIELNVVTADVAQEILDDLNRIHRHAYWSELANGEAPNSESIAAAIKPVIRDMSAIPQYEYWWECDRDELMEEAGLPRSGDDSSDLVEYRAYCDNECGRIVRAVIDYCESVVRGEHDKERTTKMKVKELIESGTRDLANWKVVSAGDNKILEVVDLDNERTVELDATEAYGEHADNLYAEIIREYGEGYPEERDPNRFSIWEIDYKRKSGYTLYIMIDNEGSEPLFLASGSSSGLYYGFDQVILGWFEIFEFAN